MKNIYILLGCICFALSASAQQNAVQAFHIEKPADKKDGISFSIHCDNTDTIFKEIFVSATGEYLFYWGKINAPSSVSFKGDTIAMWMVNTTLTTDLIYSLEKYSDSVKDYRLPCAYTITTVKEGVVKSYDALPPAEASKNVVGCDKVRKLGRLLQRLYVRYSSAGK